MKNNREMLKEAIAEARTVKETAIANAKLALEETITPKLKSMLAKRLEEMEIEEEMEEDEAKEMESKKMEEEMETKMEEEMSGKMDDSYEMEEELDLEELLAELEEELEETNIDPGAEPKSFLKKKPDYAQLEEEEITEGENEVTEQEEVMEMDMDMDMEMDSEIEGEDEEIDLEEMSEEDLKSFIEDVIKDMVETGELEAGDEFEAEGEEAEGEEEIEVEDETEEIMEGDEEMNEMELAITDAEFLASMLGGVALVGGVALDAAKKELMDAAKKGKKAVAATMKNLLGTSEMAEAEEMTNEVESLKNEINEVNLLNAKLLYLNKIFRAKNLTENQKAKIIPAFDKAATVKEAKLIFETISENFSDSKKSIKENRSLASKPVGVAPKRELIVEVDSQVARWQKLAGIK
jgi:hypothetical protein|tara:strand:+ start:8049 stop:9272 length:1224 start_codon:yes stop_codon:yes gene_type:complete